MTHARWPPQPPDQANRVHPAAGWAASLTRELVAKCAEHFLGQLMRAGLLATVPLPKTVTFRVGAAWAAKTDDALPVQIAEAAGLDPVVVDTSGRCFL